MRAVRDGASKKPYGSARCELEQLCCYVNPDFSVKLSDLSEHSDNEKKEKRGGHKIKCLLPELGRAGRENIWRSIRTPLPRAKYFPVRPSHSVNKYILTINHSREICF